MNKNKQIDRNIARNGGKNALIVFCLTLALGATL